MKKFIDGLKIWAGMFVFLFLASFCTYFVLKARNSSVSWLPTDTTNPSALYVNSNEILTAAKRNTLVGNLWWVKIKTMTGTTSATTDSTVFAHGLDWNKILSLICSVRYAGTTFYPMTFFTYSFATSTQYARITTFDTTNITISHGGSSTSDYRWQQYRCVVMYID